MEYWALCWPPRSSCESPIQSYCVTRCVATGPDFGFGSHHSAQSTSSLPRQVSEITGIAVAKSPGPSEEIYVYFHDRAGNVWERTYLNSTLGVSGDRASYQSLVTDAIPLDSPLAAVSFLEYGQPMRQIFFVNSEGMVSTMSTSSDPSLTPAAWSTPSVISENPAMAGSRTGLAACSDRISLNRTMVFYGSPDGGVEELTWHFDNPKLNWINSSYFDWADAASGIACVVNVQQHLDRSSVNIYMRHEQHGALQQVFRPLVADGTQSSWRFGSGNLKMEKTSSLAACSDRSGRQFIFHQLNNGSIQRVEVGVEPSNGFKTYKVVQDGAHRTSLAAIDASDGALVFFRDPKDPLSIRGKDMTDAQAQVFEMKIP